MKKVLAIALASVLMLALVAACGEGGGSSAEKFELALVTDLGTIDDKSFNQGSWEGVERYAKENNITYKYYKPADQGDDVYLNAIDLAIEGGAKVVVTPGFLFGPAVLEAQDRYPDTKFIILDAAPNNDDWSSDTSYVERVGSNTVSIMYAEEQSGFLAGYAAVHAGYRNLGYMGGMAVPAVVRFGRGYVEGAEYAAQELGLGAGDITLSYYYTGVFAGSPEIQTMAASWYDSGVEVIFACGGGIYTSICQAAEQAGKFVIGVDGDQSAESPTIITSAMKLLSQSVYDQLAAFYAGSFPGGQTLRYSADNLGVGLPPVATSKLGDFTQAQYDAIYAALQNGSVVVGESTNPDPSDISTSVVAVTYIS